MRLISHRGNLWGALPERENSPDYIDEAISNGYDVEIDIWMVDMDLFLGHDKPQYKTSLKWLLNRKKSLWVHTKNIGALTLLINTSLRVFYHTNEQHTIINRCSLIWSHNIEEAGLASIIPLLSNVDVAIPDVFGVCSDVIANLRVV